MSSEESKDGGNGTDIVRGGLGFSGGEMDIATVVGDKDVVVSATRFHGQLTSEVGSRVSQSEGVDERREASAREGWKGGVLEERRFFLTTSR